MGHGGNSEAVFDGYAVVEGEGLEKRSIFGIHFVLSKINNFDRIGTNMELSRTRSSEKHGFDETECFQTTFRRYA